MGAVVPPLGLQGGCQTLTGSSTLVASVVPDVSGVDKAFDYLVPARLIGGVGVGCRVRINLNNRRVSGWVVSLSTTSDVDPSRLMEIVSVSGQAVDPVLMPLVQWVSQSCFGTLRSVLVAASAPRVRAKPVSSRVSPTFEPADDDVARAAHGLLGRGGGLLVVPPLASALSAVSAAATGGSVLVLCPTVRMVRMGAAALRRRGLTTAEIPDEWDLARAGVNVVLGARTGVFAPCASLSAIVVIDEHDEAFQEERSPTWSAPRVALERGRREQVPVIVTSSVPSAWARHEFSSRVSAPVTPQSWPPIAIENLNDLPVARSLLGNHMLASARRAGDTVACILNTTGIARLLACESCRSIQTCAACGVALAQGADHQLVCPRCDGRPGSVCRACGRTAFRILSGGIGHVARELRKSSGRDVVEVSSATVESLVGGGILVGTEALLNRLPGADVVVFCDIDRDLSAPRVSAPRETLSLVARAARLVGASGRVIIQTRMPDHPLISALSAAVPGPALDAWSAHDMSNRRDMGLPPFSRVVRLSGLTAAETDILRERGWEVALVEEDVIARATDASSMTQLVADARSVSSAKIRVYADPARY